MIQPDNIIRSARKTLSVSIDCLGRVTVRAPKNCSQERIFSFLKDKQAWIERKVRAAKSVALPLPDLQNVNGYVFPLLGKECKIVLYHGERIAFVSEEGKSSLLYLPQVNTQKRLIKWLKENALQICGKITAREAEKMGVRYQSVNISSAKGKWGSCSGDNRIVYSYHLLFAPEEIIAYVAVHELCHVRHKNHSAAFWAEVAKYCPDYKSKRKWLQAHSVFMQIF